MILVAAMTTLQPSTSTSLACAEAIPAGTATPAPSVAAGDAQARLPLPGTEEPVLCVHCRRTASNGLRCQGFCVADSGY